MSDPKSRHQTGKDTSPKKGEYEFEIYTDGSGYMDGYGGSACLVNSEVHNKFYTLASGFSVVPEAGGQCVERAEMEALLMGLQSILDVMEWTDQRSISRLRNNPCKVFWLSDRESFVRGVQRDPSGKPVNARRSNPQLWALFKWYEPMFHITATHTKRTGVALHNVTDQVSSELRIVFKEYLEKTSEDCKKLMLDYIQMIQTDNYI